MSAGKHLAKGSIQPVLPDDGVMRIYSMRFCPYAQRVHLVLSAKKVPHHTIYINLTDKPEWLVKVSPLTKVPALELVAEPGSPTLIESLIICEYLDEKYEQNPLLPKQPIKRAQDKILIERFGSATSAFYKIVTGAGDVNDMWQTLDIFEAELGKRGTTYFAGDKPGFVDYMIWPWFERLPLIQWLLVQKGCSYDFDEKRFVKLSKWMDLLREDAAVQSFYVTPSQHVEFMRTRSAGRANYDMLA